MANMQVTPPKKQFKKQKQKKLIFLEACGHYEHAVG